MSSDFQVKRAQEIVRLNSENIKTYKPTPELVKLFSRSDRVSTKENKKIGRSFAIVRTSVQSASFAKFSRSSDLLRKRAEAGYEDGPWLVPLKWESIKYDELRLLFWLGTEKVFIQGREHGDLCSFCSRAIKCEHDGIDQKHSFNCMVNKDLLIMEE